MIPLLLIWTGIGLVYAISQWLDTDRIYQALAAAWAILVCCAFIALLA